MIRPTMSHAVDKDHLHELMRDYATHLEGQLAKANERIAGLEKDILRQSVFMEKTAEKLEQYQEWQATANVLRRPTREAKQALKKFAIEQKIEGAFSFADYLDKSNFSAAIAAKESGFFQIVETFTQQLRKEQDGEQ